MDLEGRTPHRNKGPQRIVYYIRMSTGCIAPLASPSAAASVIDASSFHVDSTTDLVFVWIKRNKLSAPLLMRPSLSPTSSPSIWHGWMLSSSSSAQVLKSWGQEYKVACMSSPSPLFHRRRAAIHSVATALTKSIFGSFFSKYFHNYFLKLPVLFVLKL